MGGVVGTHAAKIAVGMVALKPKRPPHLCRRLKALEIDALSPKLARPKKRPRQFGEASFC